MSEGQEPPDGRAPRWLLAVVLLPLVLLGLGLLSVNAYQISLRLDDARVSQSDNTSWLFAQLEVEELKARMALNRAIRFPDDPESLPQLRRAFDIYLSRLKVIDGYLRQSAALNQMRQSRNWRMIVRESANLTRQIDVPDYLLRPSLTRIEPMADRLAGFMRPFVVEALAGIVEANTQRRAELGALMTRSALLAMVLIVILLGVSAMMMLLSQQLYTQRRAEWRTRSTLEKTLAASLDGVIAARPDGGILRVNPAAERLFGLPRDRIVGTDLQSLLPMARSVQDDGDETATLVDPVGQMLRGELPPGRIALETRRPDGTPVTLELAVAQDRDSDGAPVLFAFLRDISDLVRAERDLREAHDAAVDAAEAKSRFLAVMSHEMRTPLNGVIAALDLLHQTTSLTPVQGRYLGIAESGAQSALDQINNVLELTRLDAEALRAEEMTFDLNAVIEDLAEQMGPLAQRTGNRIVLDLPPADVAQVSGPRRIFVQTLRNLLGNATKFTCQGTIRIVLRVHIAGPSRLVRVEVHDTGSGIAADKLGRIFDVFETLDGGYDRRVEGTGLGLGIARRSVELMQGEIGVTSREGAGSTFWFTARMQAPQRGGVMPLPPVQPDTADLPASHVLLVEDHPTNRAVARAMLEHLGQRVQEAESGEAALQAVREGEFDLVLTDVSMPGMDGLSMASQMRAMGVTSRIIAVTAHALPEDLRRIRAAGLTEILVKPITIARLTDILRAGVGPEAESALPTLDPRIASELRGFLTPEACRDTLDQLDVEARQLFTLLDGPVGEGARLAEAAHRFNGACALLGAKRICAQLTEAEGAARSGGRMAVHHARLTAEWARLRRQLVTALLAETAQKADTPPGKPPAGY